jgi:hypothetical protein
VLTTTQQLCGDVMLQLLTPAAYTTSQLVPPHAHCCLPVLLQCGENIDTDGEGTPSIDGCFIPPGYGSVVEQNGTVRAELCVQNRFGYTGRMYQIMTASCQICDANTFTRDVLTGTTAAAGYTAPEDCLVMPGWGIDTSLIAVPCKAGERHFLLVKLC